MKYLRPLGQEMDSLTFYLAHVTEQIDGKYYQKNLASDALTSTRNLIIEVIMMAKNQQFKKTMLVKEVMQAL